MKCSKPTGENSRLSKIASFLAKWIEQSKELPKENQAADLFVADTALERSNQFRGPDYPNALEHLGGGFVYTNDWIQAAADAAPESEPGREAFRVLLDASFKLGCCCPAGMTGYENVIGEGTRYLETHPASPIRVSVMLGLAAAYKDNLRSD